MTDKKTVEGAKRLFAFAQAGVRGCYDKGVDYLITWEAEKDAEIAAKDARIEELAKANQQLFDIGKRQFDKLESAQLAQDPEIDRYLQDAFQKGMEYANLLAAQGAGEPVAHLQIGGIDLSGEYEDNEIEMDYAACERLQRRLVPFTNSREPKEALPLYAGHPPAPEQAEALRNSVWKRP